MSQLVLENVLQLLCLHSLVFLALYIHAILALQVQLRHGSFMQSLCWEVLQVCLCNVWVQYAAAFWLGAMSTRFLNVPAVVPDLHDTSCADMA